MVGGIHTLFTLAAIRAVNSHLNNGSNRRRCALQGLVESNGYMMVGMIQVEKVTTASQSKSSIAWI
jgi:hypothetical protein